ncbi:MAG: RNA methyltransferase [Candidatus Delongbacteria bacterium]|nr:RNA methyltransferase [Candidatus Delongbacteria bacterium]
MQSRIYLGLVHHPVYNKYGDIVTTSITNLDIHDIARSCKTFGLKKFFVITPLNTQKLLLNRILKFWESDIAKEYNNDRVQALSLIEHADDVETAVKQISLQEDDCLVVSTTAANLKQQINFNDLKKLKRPVLLLFGTGNGLTKEIHEQADHVLKPIEGKGDYNHLSVRSAVAIVLDRLSSEK